MIPPQKPPSPPPEPDQVLFTVTSDNKGPWPVGVLDVYEDNAFLLPSIDPKRLRDVPPGGVVAAKHGDTFEVTFHVNRIKGQTLLGAPNEVRIGGVGLHMQYDPRTQVVKLADKSVPRDFTYTVEAPVLPDAKVLAASPPPDPLIEREFTAMPPPPPGVQQLLTRADLEAKNKFDRLQLVRTALYAKVVAAGGGSPVDVPPDKVDAMLAGGEASPYEISAAEVMLARWAGLPARLGFGFYGGEAVGAGREFHPRHGAAWLETYFEGQGWVPIVGTPPRAKPSLSEENKKKEPEVRPTDELALTVYLPVQRPSLHQLYETVRYYAAFVVPLVLVLGLLVFAYPAALKAARSRRRARWASDRGLPARIVVTYAELRDRCIDLNIGVTHHTPLELVVDIEDDREHRKLAWLVTRSLWGDLARDLRVEDAEAAHEMARSVSRRLDREQSGLNRVLAWTSRASLRDPWTREIPNVWPRPVHPVGWVVKRLRRAWRAVPRPGRQRHLAGAATLVVLVALFLTQPRPRGGRDLACCLPGAAHAGDHRQLPDRAPGRHRGVVLVWREEAAHLRLPAVHPPRRRRRGAGEHPGGGLQGRHRQQPVERAARRGGRPRVARGVRDAPLRHRAGALVRGSRAALLPVVPARAQRDAVGQLPRVVRRRRARRQGDHPPSAHGAAGVAGASGGAPHPDDHDRRHRRAQAMTLRRDRRAGIGAGIAALCVLVSACGPPNDMEVGLNEVHTNVVFGAKKVEETTTAPPQTTAPNRETRTPAPSFIAPPPVVAPVAGPVRQRVAEAVTCPSAGLYDVPPPAGTEIVGQPVGGVYPFSQKGSFQRPGRPPTPLPTTTERTIRGVTPTGDGGYRYQQVVEQLGAKTTTTYQYVKAAPRPSLAAKNGDAGIDGIYITNVITEGPGGTVEVFEPASPGLRLFPTPADLGVLWSSAAVDARHGAAMRLSGSISDRFRVDACGDLVEGWRSQVVIDVKTPDSSYTLKADYILLPDLGGLIGADKVELAGTYHGIADVKQTSETSIQRLSPIRPAPPQ